MKQFFLKTVDGLQLYGVEWPTSTDSVQTKGLIILIHGIAEHTGRYHNFAKTFNEHGYSVISMDLRGHGLSGGKRCSIPDGYIIFRDIDLLIDEARKRYPSCPYILYGHSMGGNLALSYTRHRFPDSNDRCPYQALIATSPWIRLVKYRQPPGKFIPIIRILGRLTPSMKIPLRFNYRILSRDDQIISEYRRDENICRTATLSLARTMIAMASKLDDESCHYHIPVLIEHGHADRLTCHQASVDFAERGSNIECKVWPRCFHELHNEPERNAFFEFTIDWIKAKVSC